MQSLVFAEPCMFEIIAFLAPMSTRPCILVELQCQTPGAPYTCLLHTVAACCTEGIKAKYEQPRKGTALARPCCPNRIQCCLHVLPMAHALYAPYAHKLHVRVPCVYCMCCMCSPWYMQYMHHMHYMHIYFMCVLHVCLVCIGIPRHPAGS